MAPKLLNFSLMACFVLCPVLLRAHTEDETPPERELPPEPQLLSPRTSREPPPCHVLLTKHCWTKKSWSHCCSSCLQEGKDGYFSEAFLLAFLLRVATTAKHRHADGCGLEAFDTQPQLALGNLCGKRSRFLFVL